MKCPSCKPSLLPYVKKCQVGAPSRDNSVPSISDHRSHRKNQRLHPDRHADILSTYPLRLAHSRVQRCPAKRMSQNARNGPLGPVGINAAHFPAQGHRSLGMRPVSVCGRSLPMSKAYSEIRRFAADRCGQAPYFRQARQQTLLTAYAAHPERIVRGLPTPPPLPHAVWINMPKKTRPGAAKTSYITGDICLILLDTFRWQSCACAKAQQDGVD